MAKGTKFCLCGCGHENKRLYNQYMSKFHAGHDARIKGILGRCARAEDEETPDNVDLRIPQALVHYLEADVTTEGICGYTRERIIAWAHKHGTK